MKTTFKVVLALCLAAAGVFDKGEVRALAGGRQAGVQAPAGRGQNVSPGERQGGRGREPRKPNVVSAPDLGYVHTLDALKWPAAEGEEEGTSGVAINSKGQIVVFHRAPAGKAPVLVFDQSGTFVRAFGQDLGIARAHGLRIDANDNLWITDVNVHQVFKLDPQGKVLLTLGTKGQAGKWDTGAGTQLLNQPTDLGFDGAGNVYVANSHGGPDPRIDKFDRNGRFLTTWRVEPKEGDRANVHTIAVDPDGTVYASSREQKIIRVYNATGSLQRTLEMPALVCGLYVDPRGQLWMTSGVDGQIMTVDRKTGAPLGVTGGGPGRGADQYGEAHYMTMSREGAIYIADTVNRRVTKLAKP